MTWIDGEALAHATGRTLTNIRVLAHRHQWDRITRDGRTLYSIIDATHTLHPLRPGTAIM